VAKYHGTTPTTGKVIEVHLLNYKPFYPFPFEKNCKGDPRVRWGCASKTWSFSSACKNLGAQHSLGAEIWPFEKSICVSTISPLNLRDKWTNVHPTLITQRGKNRGTKPPSPILNLHPFRRYSPPNFEVDRHRAKFCMFLHVLAPKFFQGGSPEILDRDYKTNTAPSIVQNFAAIGTRSSEITRGENRIIASKT